MKESLLYLDEVSVTRGGAQILDKVTIQVKPQEITGVLGRNGAGKSSLAYAVMGLQGYRPESGRIYFKGKDITDWSITERAKSGLTLAWQHPARYEGITVREYLRISSGGKADEETMKEALDLVQLDTSYLDRMLDKNLSGGERKRIELSSVYMMKPDLAILDEPDSGVDLLALGDITRLFRKIVNDGSSVIIITHREDVAARCDRSYLMCHGRIVLEGSAEAVRRYFLSQCRPCPDPDAEEFAAEEKINASS
ncbi:MAG: Fe-S cluster assembly ATP-binding protein [Synergistales bacterium]|jgi:Fe-S cluster assembly ATP-binding protein|nr:Fe-S cluster assembly ATP-binding protein [Synergistales bacterium]MDN5335291.1 Fe-S cluster assembly ATP-binding protein [Synergistales bacterium]HAG22637.1 ABC transporter ATP-binding protein [Synergistaceae bacterium]